MLANMINTCTVIQMDQNYFNVSVHVGKTITYRNPKTLKFWGLLVT